MRGVLVCLAVTLLLAACAVPNGSGANRSPITSAAPAHARTPTITAPDVARIDSLLTRTRDLLLLAPDVARIKWNEKIPIENVHAESDLIEAAGQGASRLNGDPTLFRAFFQAQIDASKFVQTELFKQWLESNVPRLTLTRSAAQVQKQSDSLTPALMHALAEATPVLAMPGARSLIETHAHEIMPTRSALSDPTREIALRPLLQRATP